MAPTLSPKGPKKEKWRQVSKKFSKRKEYRAVSKRVLSAMVIEQNESVPFDFASLFEQFQIAKELKVPLAADVRVKNDLGQTALQFALTHPIVFTNDTDYPWDRKGKICNIRLYERCKADCASSFVIANNAMDLRFRRQAANSREGKLYDRAARLSLVKMMLDAGADVNNRDDFGCTPIHIAACLGDLELLETLIDAGADINNQNGVGATPLHDAIYCGNEAMVQLLLSRGARVDLRTLRRHTPLHWAALLDRKNTPASVILKALLDHPDVRMNIPNFEKRTPFHYIMCNFYDDSDILRRCIELGADINAKDCLGATPFSVNGLNLIYRKCPVLPANIEERRIILELMNIIETRTGKPVFDHYNLKVIDGNPEVRSYYEKCRTELQDMKKRYIKDTLLTYFEVLTEPLEVFKQYASDKELLNLVLEEFQNSDYRSVYPIYGCRFQEMFKSHPFGCCISNSLENLKI